MPKYHVRHVTQDTLGVELLNQIGGLPEYQGEPLWSYLYQSDLTSYSQVEEDDVYKAAIHYLKGLVVSPPATSSPFPTKSEGISLSEPDRWVEVVDTTNGYKVYIIRLQAQIVIQHDLTYCAEVVEEPEGRIVLLNLVDEGSLGE